MYQSKKPTGADSQDVPVEDLHEDPPLLFTDLVKHWHEWITVEFRKYHVMKLVGAMMKRGHFPLTHARLKAMACSIEGAVYRVASTVREYTARLDTLVDHIPRSPYFLYTVYHSASESNSTEGIAPAGPGTDQNPQLPYSQDTMGQGLAPPQLHQGAVAAAAVPSPSPQPPAPLSSGPTAQALADEVRHIASGLGDLDMNSEQQH